MVGEQHVEETVSVVDFSSKCLSPYNEFLSRLKCSDCSDTVEEMRRFVLNLQAVLKPTPSSPFSRSLTLSTLDKDEVARRFHSFIDSIVDRLVAGSSSFAIPQLQASRSHLLASSTGQQDEPEKRRNNNVSKRYGEFTDGYEDVQINDEDDGCGAAVLEDGVLHEEIVSTVRLNLSEHLERFLSSKLSSLLLDLMEHESTEDQLLKQKFEWLEKWIQPQHLDLDRRLDALLSTAPDHPVDRSLTKDLGSSSRTNSPVEKVSHNNTNHDSDCPIGRIRAVRRTVHPSANPSMTWRHLIHLQCEGLASARCPHATLTFLLNLCRISSELAAELYRIQIKQEAPTATPTPASEDNSSNNSNDFSMDSPGSLPAASVSVVVAADDLLPVLIWILIRSKPNHFLRSLEFVATFRHPTLLKSEDLYFFTMVSSAAEFLKRLIAFVDLNIVNSETRQFVIQSCPPEFVRRWVEDGSDQTTASSPSVLAHRRPSSMVSPPLTQSHHDDPPCYDSFPPPSMSHCSIPAVAMTASDASAGFFNGDVYERFLGLLRQTDTQHQECSDVVAHLRRFVAAALLPFDDEALDATRTPRARHVLRPSSIRQVVNTCVRLLTQTPTMRSIFSWESLIGDTGSNKQPSHQPASSIVLPPPLSSTSASTAADPVTSPENTQVDQLKKQYVLIIILTECIERFIFGKISHAALAWIVRDSLPSASQKSHTDNNELGQPVQQHGLLNSIFAPFSFSASPSDAPLSRKLHSQNCQLNQSTISRSPVFGPSSLVGPCASPSVALTDAIAKLKSKISLSGMSQISTSMSANQRVSECPTFMMSSECGPTNESKRAIHFIERRLKKLDAMMSPLEKLKSIITLCHIASGLADDVDLGTNQQQHKDNGHSLLPSSATHRPPRIGSTANEKRVNIIAEVGLILLFSDPPHLEVHLDYISKFRHPTLLSPDSYNYVLVVRIAIAALEALALDPSGPDDGVMDLLTLKYRLMDVIKDQLPSVPIRRVPPRFEHEI